MWQDLLGNVGELITTVVLPPLAVAVAGLIVAVLTKYARKVGLDLTDAQRARLKELIQEGIQAAEEYARRNVGTPGPAKRQQAIAYVEQHAPPEVTREEIGKLIDAELPLVRAKLATANPFLPLARG